MSVNMSAAETTKLSKKMSLILRHQPEKYGITIRADGYVLLDDLVNCNLFKSCKWTREMVEQVVANNDKQRFTIIEEPRENEPTKVFKWIRANQGHSIATVNDLELRPLVNILDFPETVIHGTTLNAYKLIKESGALMPMTRNHIHLAKGLPGENGVISGMRRSSQVLIYIDIEKCLANGIHFSESSNGVILTSSKIPIEYFAKVDIKGQS